MLLCPSCGHDNPGGTGHCLVCAAPLDAAAQPSLEVERKLVTILFADIVGSTELGSALDPERLRLVLNAYFSSMSAAVEAWGGTVEKFIGDAVMAVFGVPVVREDDAARALRAALEMLRRLIDLNEDIRRRHQIALAIRIGVNTGEVLAPTGPMDQRLLVGDAANVAARLQTAAESGTVLVSDRTCQAVREGFQFGPSRSLTLKGRSATVVARRLLDAPADALANVPRLRSAMVGRDGELRVLLDRLHAAISTGSPAVVLLEGAAGVGKSRLALEFGRMMSALRPDATLMRARCVASVGGIGSWTLAELLRSTCGISLDDPAEVTGRKLRLGLRRVLSRLDAPAQQVEETVFAMAKSAGMVLPDNPLDRATAQEVAVETARAWPLFVRAQAMTGPAVLIVEDLHWADDQLIDVLTDVVAHTTAPLLVLATARPEFADAHPKFLAGPVKALTHVVEALPHDQANALLDQLVTGAHLPDPLRDDILTTADGNPFFLEEIVQALIDGGRLLRADGSWAVSAEVGNLALPDTVHTLLASRIDALPTYEKRTLQEASVMGRTFWEPPLVEALGEPARASLSELERRDLVLCRPFSMLAGVPEFAFKHVLVRDVAYASVPMAHRARSHARVGEWLDATALGEREQLAELLAYHFAAAASGEGADLAWSEDPSGRERVRRRAVEALLLAGSAARSRAALQKSFELHHEALHLAATDDERRRVLEEIGDDHQASFHGDEALTAYLDALAIARWTASDAADRSRLCMKAAVTIAATPGAFSSFPNPALADELISEGLGLESGDEVKAGLLCARAWCGTAWRFGNRADPLSLDERVRSAEEGLMLAGQLDLPDLAMRSAVPLGQLRFLSGDFAGALAATQRQLEFLERVPSALAKAEALQRLAEMTILVAGDFEQGEHLARRCGELGASGGPHQVMHATFWLMCSQYFAGRWREMLPDLERHLAAYREEPVPGCDPVQGGLALAAIVLLHRGESGRARQLAESQRINGTGRMPEGLRALYAVYAGEAEGGRQIAQRCVEGARSSVPEPFAALALVEATVALGRWHLLPHAVSVARDVQDGLVVIAPTCDRAEGLAATAAGGKAEAIRLLERALANFEDLGVPFEIARTLEALARVRPRTGRALLQRARSLYERLGALPALTRLDPAARSLGR